MHLGALGVLLGSLVLLSVLPCGARVSSWGALVRFWDAFGRRLGDFWTTFGRLLDGFWANVCLTQLKFNTTIF